MVEREAGKGKHESEKLMRTDGIDSAQLNARFPHPLSMALQHASSIKAIIHGVEKTRRTDVAQGAPQRALCDVWRREVGSRSLAEGSTNLAEGHGNLAE